MVQCHRGLHDRLTCLPFCVVSMFSPCLWVFSGLHQTSHRIQEGLGLEVFNLDVQFGHLFEGNEKWSK